MHELVAEVWRGDFLESVHHGTVAAVNAEGRLVFGVGQPDALAYPRSSNKPFQALAMVRNGLDLDGELLALAAASHSGEPFHIDGVRRILAGAGVPENDLQCTADLPLGEAAMADLLAAGGHRAPIYMNCSGKHAAMLATCVINHWPTTDYLAPDHPMQRASRAAVERLAGEPVRHDAIDGCGAPLYAISLVGLARAFRGAVLAGPATPERRVADAMRAHPEYVSGTDRIDTDLMAGVPGLLAKGGAEGVQAVALPDGRAVALKVGDGDLGQRAAGPVLVAALRRLGVEAAVLSRYAESPLLGGGHPVGAVRSLI